MGGCSLRGGVKGCKEIKKRENPGFIGLGGLCNAAGQEGTLSISCAFQHHSKQWHWDVPTPGHIILQGGKKKEKK